MVIFELWNGNLVIAIFSDVSFKVRSLTLGAIERYPIVERISLGFMSNLHGVH